MSNSHIDDCYALARKNGALGGKVIGAGGGGFLMFYAEDTMSVRHAMREAGLVEVRLRFDYTGTTVVTSPSGARSRALSGLRQRCGPCGRESGSISPAAVCARRLRRMRSAWVTDADEDVANLYNADYYRGAGADPLVDYATELTDPHTTRVYEWRGLARIAADAGATRGCTWIDFGAGAGGLARFLRRGVRSPGVRYRLWHRIGPAARRPRRQRRGLGCARRPRRRRQRN